MAVCKKFQCDLSEVYEDIPVPVCDDIELDCHDCEYLDCKYCHLSITGECPLHE